MLAEAQLRFRVVGDQPRLLDRAIEPASVAAAEFVGRGGDAKQLVEPILRIVETAGRRVDQARPNIRGVALTTSQAGYDAATAVALLEDSPQVATMMAAAADDAERALIERDIFNLANGSGSYANASADWMTLGPDASRAVHPVWAGMPLPEHDGALAVRAITHEAAHLADPIFPDVGPDAQWGIREALAELRSRDIDLLRDARDELGLRVSDHALASTLDDMRPYVPLEERVGVLAQVAGAPLEGASGAQLLRLPATAFVDELASRIAQRQNVGDGIARSFVDGEVAVAVGTVRSQA